MPSIIPTINVGLGGTGFYAISEVKRTIAKKYFDGDPNFPLTAYWAIDTEFLTADKMDKSHNKEELNFVRTFDASNIREVERMETRVTPEAIKSTLANPNATNYGDFIPPNAAEHIEVGGDGASGIGLIGKIAFADNFSRICGAFEGIVADLMGHDAMNRLKAKSQYAQYSREDRLNVFIYCSFGGGTGKGMALIFAAMAKEILSKQFSNQRDRYNISIINYLPECFRARGRSLAKDPSTFNYILKNQYATYKEIEWCLEKGYANENFFKDYFRKGGSSPKTENFINSIYNISPRLEKRGIEISSYQSLNQIVANVFSFLIMNEESKEILASNSNDTSKKDAAVPEKETGLVRNLKYCRIGRYSLVMPEFALFEYTKLYFTRKILDDFLNGGLESDLANLTYPQIENKPTDYEFHPNTYATTKQGDIEQEFNKHFRLPIEGKESDLTFPGDARNYQPQQVLSFMTDVINRFETHAISFFEQSKRPEKVTDNVLDSQLTLLTKGFGLKFSYDFLKYLDQKLTTGVQRMLDLTKETGDYNASFFLKGLGDSNPYATEKNLDFFHFKVGAKVLVKLKEEFDNQLAGVREGINSTLLSDVSSIIERVTKPKKKSLISKIFGSENDERIPFPEDAKHMISEKIRRFNQNLKKIRPLYNAAQYVEYALFIHQYVQKRSETISALIDNLDNSASDSRDSGLIAEIDQKLGGISSMKSEANENYMIGDHENEFKGFCEDILPEKDISRDLHTRFNNEVVEQMFGTMGQDLGRNLYPKVTGFSEERIRPIRYHEETREKNWSIDKYMKFLSMQKDETLKQQVEENLKKMMGASDFLGAVDSNKFKDPGRALTFFPQQNFLEISDKDYLAQNINNWQTYTHNAKLIEQENEERVTLTRIQGLIPLFAFTDLQNAQNLYLKELNSDSSDEAKEKFLVKAHSSSFFMKSITEPFGKTLQLDSSEMTGIWNMAFHLGITGVDKRGYIKVLKVASDTKLVHFENPNKMNEPESVKRWVKISDFSQDYNDYYSLVELMKTFLFERMNELADDVDDTGQMILEKYLTNPSYPMLPKSLHDNILNTPNPRLRELHSFVNDKQRKQAYLDVYHKNADVLLKKRDFALNEGELKEIFSEASNHVGFFEDRKSARPAPSSAAEDKEEKARKIESITLETLWVLVQEGDKNNPMSSPQPISYRDARVRYSDINKHGFSIDFYAPNLDLVISNKEFEDRIGELESLDKEMKKTYAVYSKELNSYIEKKGEGDYGPAENPTGRLPMLSVEDILNVLVNDQSIGLCEQPNAKDATWLKWEAFPFIVEQHKLRSAPGPIDPLNQVPDF